MYLRFSGRNNGEEALFLRDNYYRNGNRVMENSGILPHWRRFDVILRFLGTNKGVEALFPRDNYYVDEAKHRRMLTDILRWFDVNKYTRQNYTIRRPSETSYWQMFNDIAFYKRLCQHSKCTRVDIDSIRFSCYRQRRSCFGIQVVYRQSFLDQSFKLRTGNGLDHDPSPYYHWHNQEFSLEAGEYITGLSMYKAEEAITGITLHTNLRERDIGLCAGTIYTTMAVNRPHTRIVAFCGIHKVGYRYGNWKAIGCYAESVAWEKRGPYILMRALVHRRRAQPKKEDVFQRLFCLPDDTFQIVMGFHL